MSAPTGSSTYLYGGRRRRLPVANFCIFTESGNGDLESTEAGDVPGTFIPDFKREPEGCSQPEEVFLISSDSFNFGVAFAMSPDAFIGH